MKSIFSTKSKNTLSFSDKFYVMLGLALAIIQLNNVDQGPLLEKQFNSTELTALELGDTNNDSQDDAAIHNLELIINQNTIVSLTQKEKIKAFHSFQHSYSSRAPPCSKA